MICALYFQSSKFKIFPSQNLNVADDIVHGNMNEFKCLKKDILFMIQSSDQCWVAT